MLQINAEEAKIFRITHVENVEWILAHGLHCSSSDILDPNFKRIGHEDLIQKRPRRQVPIAPWGNLGDYVPFYFTPRSPMLYNIKTGWNGVPVVPMPDIVILVTSLPRLTEAGVPFVFADRHAYLVAARFASDLAELDRIDWDILQRSDFAKDPGDPGKLERYQAEALVHRHLPVEKLDEIICSADARTAEVQQFANNAGIDIGIRTRRECFF